MFGVISRKHGEAPLGEFMTADFILRAEDIRRLHAKAIVIVPPPQRSECIKLYRINFEMRPSRKAFHGNGALCFVWSGTLVKTHVSSIRPIVVCASGWHRDSPRSDPPDKIIKRTLAPVAPGFAVGPPGTGIEIVNDAERFTDGDGSAHVQCVYVIEPSKGSDSFYGH